MRTSFDIRRALQPAALALAAASVLALAAPAAQATATACTTARNHLSYGLTTDQQLVSFRTCAPSTFRSSTPVTGLIDADTRLVAIDFRVQDGLLYGLGDGGGIYTLDLGTAVATKASQLSTALDGDRFGMDFNPAANALRITSDRGQNLRHPFANPEPRITVVDLSLNYAVGVTASGVAGAAYTNNDLDATTGTTLFVIDTVLDQVVLQAPPNNGSLAFTGKLGANAEGPVGFDIYARVDTGITTGNRAVASYTVDGIPKLVSIDLLTGKATVIATTAAPLIDLALTLDAD